MIEKAAQIVWLHLDLHASQIKVFLIFRRSLMGAPLIANYFLERDIQGDDVVVVSPDHGGVTRAPVN